MGNCIRKEPGMQWGGEDWGSPAPAASPERQMFYPSDDGKDSDVFSSSVNTNNEKTATTTEVKIKITRKQLEELLGKTDIQGSTVQQVLSQLIKVSDRFESHQRSWRPALRSIPE